MKYFFRNLTAAGLVLAVLITVNPVNATQYTFAAGIETMEKSGKKPIPTTITWLQSQNAKDGDVIIDHSTVVLVEADTDEEIGSVDVAATATSIELNKTNVPEMKVFTHYEVRVDEYYTDGDSSKGYSSSFYTAPPKLKNLRVKDKTIESDGDMTVTLKWRVPTNLRSEYLYYDYKISRAKDAGALVLEDYTYGSDVNSVEINNLPVRKLQIQVRARKGSDCTGQWSAWKKFNAPTTI
ncbi:MAG: hypothetical protein ACD_72C00534G0004 [uncultured bacterium]|nr:MAG: hypothetical protein ACD_72C00534G0004 [uncultured bacterium]